MLFCCSASLLCILFNICEVLGKWFLHHGQPSQFYFVLLTTWSTICTSKVFSSHEKDLEAGLLSTKQKINQMSLLISSPPSNLSVSKTLQKQSVHRGNRSVFITEILPLPHGLRQGLFGLLPNLNILACKKTSNR